MLINQQDLINAKIKAFGDSAYVRALLKAQAYYNNTPGIYASYSGKLKRADWPRAFIPIARRVVDTSAGMLFGTAPTIRSKSKALSAWLDQVLYTDNNGRRLLLNVARCGGIYGSVAIRYEIDPQRIQPVRIVHYSPLEFHPIWDDRDREKLVGIITEVRRKSQVDPTKYFRLREMWLEDRHVIYKPLAESSVTNGYSISGFQIESEEPNQYGEIPFIVIQNQQAPEDPTEGIEDMFGLYDLVDRINIAYDDWSRGNGISARQVMFGKLLATESFDVKPGDVILGNQAESDLKAVQNNPLFQSFAEFVDRVESQVYGAARSSNVDPKTVTGLGELSGRALHILYGPLLALTAEKQENYGRDGVEKLLEAVCRCAKRLGVDATVTIQEWREEEDPETGQIVQRRVDVEENGLAEVDPEDPASYDVELTFADPFPPNAMDRKQEVDSVVAAAGIGYPTEYVAQELARIFERDPEDVKIAMGVDDTYRQGADVIKQMQVEQDQARINAAVEKLLAERGGSGGRGNPEPRQPGQTGPEGGQV